MDAYQVVILPDQRYLPASLVARLEDWVERGGVLISTGLTGTRSAENLPLDRFVLGDLLGIQYLARYEPSHGYLRTRDERLTAGTLPMAHVVECPVALGRIVGEDVQVLAELDRIYVRDDGRPLLRHSPVGEPSGCPGITVRQVGSGLACYVAAELFYAYQKANQWNAKHILANLIRALAPDLPASIESPVWLEVVHTRQPGRGRAIVHLINSQGNRPIDGNGVCVEQVLPVHDVVVLVRRDARPARVTAEPGGAELDWEYDGDTLAVSVPRVDIHLAVCIV